MIQYVLIIFIPVAEVPGDGSSAQVRPLIIKSLWTVFALAVMENAVGVSKFGKNPMTLLVHQ